MACCTFGTERLSRTRVRGSRFRARKDPRVPLGLLELLAPLAQRAVRGHKAPLALRATRVPKDPPELRVARVLKERPAPRAIPAMKDRRVPPELLGLREQLAARVPRDPRGMKGTRVLRDPLEPQVLRGAKVRRATKATPGTKDPRGQKALLGLRELPDPLGLLARPEPRDRRVILVIPGLLARRHGRVSQISRLRSPRPPTPTLLLM